MRRLGISAIAKLTSWTATSVPRLLRAIARAARAFAADHRRPTVRPATHEEVALHREARRQASLLRADTVRDGILLGRPL